MDKESRKRLIRLILDLYKKRLDKMTDDDLKFSFANENALVGDGE